MKKLGVMVCIPAVLLAGTCFAQQVIATAGSSATGAGIQISWTIGEPVTATAPGSGFYLTQGFQQGQPELQTDNQQISLSAGWNVISTRVIPEDRNLMDIFQSLITSGQLKKVMNEEGKTLEDWGIFGSWQNGIGNLSATEGYNVNVTSPGILSVQGSTFIFPFHIQLAGGWNIISWPSSAEQEGMTVLNSLISEGKLIKVMDEAGKTIEDWGIFGGWTNNIGNFKPGEGYKVKVTGDCTLKINESGTKSDIVLPAPLAATYFVPAFRGNGTEHMNIHVVNLAESGIQPGDEIGVFDGDVCVGAVKIPNQFLMAVSIPVSANDGLEGKNGFTVGNMVDIRLYRSGVEYQVSFHPLNSGETVFKKGSSLFAQIGMPTGLLAFEGNMEVKCYPNPFSEQITIDIMLAARQNINIKVFDTKGALVRTLFDNEAEGKMAINWDGRNQAGAKMISGTYFVKVNDSTFKVLLEQLNP